jgi:RNA-directed DNA polymerase
MTKDLFFETAFPKWVEKERKVFSSGKRRYLHFDAKIPFNKKWQDRFESLLRNSLHSIGHHQFFPFIKADIKTPRYKKTNTLDEYGKPIRVIDIKERPIAYASHFDAFIYSWYSTYLTELYESHILSLGIYENVIAYLEKNASNIEFAKDVVDLIKSKGECIAMAFDISSFFDGLDHEILYNKWCKVLGKTRLPRDHFKVFNSLTNYSFVLKADLDGIFSSRLKQVSKKKTRINKYCTPQEFREKVRAEGKLFSNPFQNNLKESLRFGQRCGIPQGSPISACLSNIYMIDFDLELKKKIDSINGLFRRYCDDIIVVCNIEDAPSIKEFVVNLIRDFQLEINDKKTEITIFRQTSKGLRGFNFENFSQYQNLQYLGFEFNGINTYIRSATMSRYHKRTTGRVRETLKAAYGNNSIGNKVFRKKLINRCTDKGERNFHAYAKRASEIMNSLTIRRQIKNNREKVKEVFLKKKDIFEEKMLEKGKRIRKMA